MRATHAQMAAAHRGSPCKIRQRSCRDSTTWFDRACVGENPETAWTVFLCYATDEHSSDITKLQLHESDWTTLRESISPSTQKVVDMAAIRTSAPVPLGEIDRAVLSG